MFRFFALLKDYRQKPPQFSITYKRRKKTRTISPEVEKTILHQLRWEKRLIENKDKGIAEIRFWRESDFLGIQKIRLEDMNLVRF